MTRAKYTYFNGPDGIYLTGPLAIGPFPTQEAVNRAVSLLEQGFSGARNVQATFPDESISTTGHEGDENNGAG